MENTSYTICRQLVALCLSHGVRRVVLSPGSRNAPLLVAFAREKAIEHLVVVDERVAGFIALGMATRSGEPVALVCTSGTALLNYAPAVAEAYYRHVPLIVISADRPDEWIDQDDSQTIRQQGVLGAFVKQSYHLPAHADDTSLWYARRLINDALLQAQTPCSAPVHINVPLGGSLCEVTDVAPEKPVCIEDMRPVQQLSPADAARLALTISGTRKVMILATMAAPSPVLQEALSLLAKLPQVVVLTESIANMHDDAFIPTIDRVLTVIDNSEKSDFAPQLLITMGGSPVSRMVKEFLRRYSPAEHWRIGNEPHVIDTMQSLTCRLQLDAASVLSQVAPLCTPLSSHYAMQWADREIVATALHNRVVDTAPWCDLRAFASLSAAIPSDTVLHLSNGTSIRYAQLFDTPQVAASYCNRGVSGIDGSTSTALGASMVDDAMHLLITGDMSFGYDTGALATGLATPRFKIVVIDNGGGGIFRFIKGPSDLPELEECFEVKHRQPIEGYAHLHGFRYFHADSEDTLKDVLPQFFAESEQPAILAITTPNEVNATVLRHYMRRARE
ncbi:MAG: 2-succinyl-5-enolpyruvyl-6-hydroxy-3-cyclohexene-1-carboxylic-acid synthase [Bacteroidaceae bacterium]|nr:2-succinyl-5-enolpyruvyl-6-hydroxy-3-cyclohexene-1-carboxylic-acid synthase [Bacteroidaceae bacterium]